MTPGASPLAASRQQAGAVFPGGGLVAPRQVTRQVPGKA